MTNATTRATTARQIVDSLLAAKDVKDFTFGPELPDVRGWTVIGPAASAIGTVDRIMLDAAEKKPRYLSVKHSARRGSMLLPLGIGVADVTHRQITLEHVAPEVLRGIPTMTGDTVTPELERQVVQAFLGGTVTGTPADWYTTSLFDGARLRTAAPVDQPSKAQTGASSGKAALVA